MSSANSGEQNEYDYTKQTQRKRSKEKQRRLDIAASIERLSDIMLKADSINLIRRNNQLYFVRGLGSPSSSSTTGGDHGRIYEDSNSSKYHRHGGYLSPSNQNQPLNRTEIIKYATQMIEKLATENENLNLKLIQYEHDLLLASTWQKQTTAAVASNSLLSGTSEENREMRRSTAKRNTTDHGPLPPQPLAAGGGGGYTPPSENQKLVRFTLFLAAKILLLLLSIVVLMKNKWIRFLSSSV